MPRRYVSPSGFQTRNKRLSTDSVIIANTMQLELEHGEHALRTIRQLGLESLTQFNLLCQCMSPVATAIKDGRITSQGDLKKFLEGLKKPVEVAQVPKQYLRKLFDGEEVRLGVTEGKRTIKEAAGLFPGGIYLHDGFEKLPDEVLPIPETLLEISELVENGKFAEFLPEGRVLGHEEQVLLFVETHRDKLRKDGYATFMPFLKGGKVFVARVLVHDVGRLEVRVLHFGYGDVWRAERRHRVVIPQQALKV